MKKSTLDVEYTDYSKRTHVPGVKPLKADGTSKSTPLLGGTRLEERITINAHPDKLYAYWRDFTNLPTICKHLANVTVHSDTRSRWTVIGPLNKELSWEATIIEDIPNELISWRSFETSDFINSGSVQFRATNNDAQTEVVLIFAYNPPAGPIGALVAKLTAKEPSALLREQLEKFKELMEKGYIFLSESESF